MVLPPDAGKHVSWLDDGVGLVEGGDGGATSLVLDDGDVVVVDAGMKEEAARALAPVTGLLILSQTHVPHARHAHLFDRVWAPRAEVKAMRDPDGYCETFGVPRTERGLVRQWLGENGYRPARIEKPFRPGGTIILPRMEWQVLPAVGTTPGSVVLFEPKRRLLFAGDLGPAPGAPLYGWPTSDLEELENTLKRLGELEVELLIASHAPPRRRGAKQVFRDLAAAIRQRDATYYDALETPRSVQELVDLARIQGESVGHDPMARWMERVMVEKHVTRLLARGLAFARQDGRYEQA